MVFSGFGEFHQKEFPALLPLLQLLFPVGQLTRLVLRARVLQEPATGKPKRKKVNRG